MVPHEPRGSRPRAKSSAQLLLLVFQVLDVGRDSSLWVDRPSVIGEIGLEPVDATSTRLYLSKYLEMVVGAASPPSSWQIPCARDFLSTVARIQVRLEPFRDFSFCDKLVLERDGMSLKYSISEGASFLI